MATQDGNSALNAASIAGHVDAVRLLLDHGADVEATIEVCPGVADALFFFASGELFCPPGCGKLWAHP